MDFTADPLLFGGYNETGTYEAVSGYIDEIQGGRGMRYVNKQILA